MKKKNKLYIAGAVILTIFFIYLMIYFDLWLRAKEAYQEGEKYWSWYEQPGLKIKNLEENFAKEKIKLDKQLEKRKIKPEEYEKKLNILKYENEREKEESAIKYAYFWYQTAVELFSPPESKWVKLSQVKMQLAKEKWKEELRAKGIKFEEYMLE
jgi:hypothetical protein